MFLFQLFASLVKCCLSWVIAWGTPFLIVLDGGCMIFFASRTNCFIALIAPARMSEIIWWLGFNRSWELDKVCTVKKSSRLLSHVPWLNFFFCKISLQTASMETDVDTAATRAPPFPATNASHGMHSTHITITLQSFTKRLGIAAIFVAIQGDLVWMGLGV